MELKDCLKYLKYTSKFFKVKILVWIRPRILDSILIAAYSQYRRLRLDWSSDAPDLLGSDEDEKSETDIKAEIAKNLYGDESLALSPQAIADGLGVSQGVVSNSTNS